MEILAHRLRTEMGQLGNSRKNLIALYNMGIIWVEADIYLGINGKILVHHPGKVKPNIDDVMSLQNLLGLISSLPKINCILDLKQDSEELVRRAVFLITALGLQDKIYLTAFQRKIRIPFMVKLETNGKLLLLAKRLDPQIKTHIIATWPWDLPKLVKKYQADAISFGWLLEPAIVCFISKILFKVSAAIRNLPGQVSEVKQRGVKVWAGIFNTVEDMKYFSNLGIDGIMTDNPKLGVKFKKNWEAANG